MMRGATQRRVREGNKKKEEESRRTVIGGDYQGSSQGEEKRNG